MGNDNQDEERGILLNSQSKKYRKYGDSPQSKSLPTSSVRIHFRPASDEKSKSALVDDVFASPSQLFSSGGFQLLSKFKHCAKYGTMAMLTVVWLGCIYVLMVKSEKVKEMHQLSIPKDSIRGYVIPKQPTQNHIVVSVEGALLPKYYANLSTNWMNVWVEMLMVKNVPGNLSSLDATEIVGTQNVSKVWKVPLVSEELIGVVPEVTLKENFKLDSHSCDDFAHCFLKVQLTTNLKANFPITLGYNMEPINVNEGVVYAAIVLVFLYVLIIFEFVHKTVAAMVSSTVSVAILAALNARPTMSEIVSWIDIETLLLLFSMMVLVAISSETGIFDYMAVVAYKVTGGKVWPLINTLCFFTAAISCFLDNVTTALLMTPVTIRLCEVTRINPVPVLINMIIYSNIGGAVTPIGDPPNVIIASNAAVLRAGVNFTEFTLHIGVGVLLVMVVVYVQLRVMYRNINDLRYDEPNDVQDLRREIDVWRRAAASMGSYSKEECTVKDSLLKRTSKLVGKLNNKTSNKSISLDNYTENLQDLESQYPIRDKVLLVKSVITLSFVICVFFLHSVPEMNRLGLGWTALLGALLLLILCDREDMEAIFGKVEWSTLLFFASLFILMEALGKLGLIDWIGRQTQSVIMSVEQESRLTVAILIILWVSACASAFVDNIPLTTMMIRVATTLGEDKELGLPLKPLIWALSFGACLGGNGTLFGSSCNIVCAGVAEQHGYKFTFMQFMKVGFPVMISSMCAATIYLIVAHVVWCWH